MSGWRRKANAGAMRAVPSLMLFGAAASVADQPRLSTIVLMWTLCVLFSRSAHLTALTRSPEALWLPFHYPISDPALFFAQRRAFLLQSIWIAVDWAAFGLGLFIQSPSFTAALALSAAALAQYAATIGLAAALVWLLPRFSFDLARTFCALAMFAGVLLVKSGVPFAGVTAVVSDTLRAYTPPGWVQGWAEGASQGRALAWLGLLAASVGGFGIAAWALRAIGEHFSTATIFGYHLPGEMPPEQFVHGSGPPPAASRVPDSATVDPARIRKHCEVLLQRAPGSQFALGGRAQCRLLSLLGPRQKRLIDYLRPTSLPGFTRGWVLALSLLVLVRLLQWAGLPPDWAGLISAGAVLTLATPLFGGIWPGMSTFNGETGRIPLNAFFPVGFGEITRLMLKINDLRIIAAWPLMLIVARGGFASIPVPWSAAIVHSLGAAAVMITLQPFWAIAAFSQGTNDTSSRWWFSLLIVVAISGGVLGLIICSAAAIGSGNPWTVSACAAAAFIYTHGLLLIYGWAWRHGVFDLVAIAKG